MGCPPPLERPWVPLRVSRHRTSPAPRPSKGGETFHRRHSCRGLPVHRLQDTASKLRTDRGRGQERQPADHHPTLSAWGSIPSERLSSLSDPVSPDLGRPLAGRPKETVRLRPTNCSLSLWLSLIALRGLCL